MNVSIGDRVGLGAMVLDASVVGWAERIDRGRLLACEAEPDILEQLFGSLFLGVAHLHLRGTINAHAAGFHGRENEYAELRREWDWQVRTRVRATADERCRGRG